MGKDFVVAIDIGGSRIRVALVSEVGDLLGKVTFPNRGTIDPTQAITQLQDTVRQLISSVGIDKIAAIGCGVPGPVDPRRGVILTPPNLPGWWELPIKSILEEWGVPVHIGNDANVAALGEHRFGAGKGIDDLIYITVSTGIGTGIMVKGQLLLGYQGLGGEAGHMTIDPDGPACGCGKKGCLEALASGTAVARQARERLNRGVSSVIPHFGEAGEITSEAVAAAARAGDSLAKDIMEEAATSLAIGVVNLVHIFDPQTVIIGGGVSGVGDLLFGPVRRAVEREAMPPYKRVPIVPAQLGEEAGLYGAVALAR